MKMGQVHLDSDVELTCTVDVTITRPTSMLTLLSGEPFLPSSTATQEHIQVVYRREIS
jgi:hypothetical protein